VEVIASGKHSSLLRYNNNYCHKKLYSTGPLSKNLSNFILQNYYFSVVS
jgi:hypothetical protein